MKTFSRFDANNFEIYILYNPKGLQGKRLSKMQGRKALSFGQLG